MAIAALPASGYLGVYVTTEGKYDVLIPTKGRYATATPFPFISLAGAAACYKQQAMDDQGRRDDIYPEQVRTCTLPRSTALGKRIWEMAIWAGEGIRTAPQRYIRGRAGMPVGEENFSWAKGGRTAEVPAERRYEGDCGLQPKRMEAARKCSMAAWDTPEVRGRVTSYQLEENKGGTRQSEPVAPSTNEAAWVEHQLMEGMTLDQDMRGGEGHHADWQQEVQQEYKRRHQEWERKDGE